MAKVISMLFPVPINNREGCPTACGCIIWQQKAYREPEQKCNNTVHLSCCCGSGCGRPRKMPKDIRLARSDA